MPDSTSSLPPLDPDHVAIVEASGGKLLPLEPIGAEVHGIDLTSESPPPPDLPRPTLPWPYPSDACSLTVEAHPGLDRE